MQIYEKSFQNYHERHFFFSVFRERRRAGTPKGIIQEIKKRLESLSKSQSLLSYKIYKVLILLQVGLSVRMLCTTS